MRCSIAALAPGTYEANQTGYSVTIPLVSGGRQLTITSTEIEFVRGRFDHQITFNGNGVSFPAAAPGAPRPPGRSEVLSLSAGRSREAGGSLWADYAEKASPPLGTYALRLIFSCGAADFA